MTATTLSASAVPESELTKLDSLQRSLPEKSPLRFVLAKMTEDLRQGTDVILARQDELVSTTDAAKVLGVSRPHLYKILDSGAIDYTPAGSHRRIRLGDLHAYLAKTDQIRKADALYIANRGTGNAPLIDLID
ncbi:helix-turn-helix domain-containing protein [Curtobacterium flaccumfaciens pv. flaccumfaciens]|uniref:helix-turn-helix domain-containing protein n=1 Tax=Curtobacterium flaccumfaciens TaxID=2035 RepID=UPI00217E0CD1|nr:helix-turn-helix domain-containing protein [Curtobacterium flaccumfaciens]MCS6552788.1 helix-turn-helix domain-containing protein [Curtobacterium flaccumfaciens pv. flaccumfaciens]